MNRAIYAGSFDPFTLGHDWIVTETKNFFDEVLLVIGKNPAKKYFFPLEIRRHMLEERFKDDPKVKIIVLEDGYLADFARNEGIKYLIRGIRNTQDFEYERTVLRQNQAIYPEIQSVFLMPPSHLSEISSSNVKSLVGPGGWKMLIETMVPTMVTQQFMIFTFKEQIRPFWNKLMLPSEAWWNTILNRYSESHRYYHTLEHISDLLRQTKDINLNLFEYQVLILSILFHDLVYDPKQPDNEEQSNIQFLKFASEVDLHADIKDRVSTFILATKTHVNEQKDCLLDIFLDLDLSILGSPAARFAQYEKEIRQEYSFVPQDIYTRERARIMAKLSIKTFASAWGNKFQNTANTNLKPYKI